jgi:alkylation response protein AidB-like acyl-CoA dehydrogenase
MDLTWSAADRAFRDEVRTFLDEALTPELRWAGSKLTSVYATYDVGIAWQKILHAKGWVAPAWPEAFGGCGWSVTQRYIWAQEAARAGTPPVSPMGIGMCGPVLIGHGTPAQQQHFLPRMLSGDDYWCQGYSEPESGSDLASLQMSAVEDGDDFVCNGHKLWTTHANVANWIFCLVRTAPRGDPAAGHHLPADRHATPASRCSRSSRSAASTSRTTCSSPTCACPRPTRWAARARAGRWPST